MTVSRALAQLIQFGIFVVAAKVLLPADFGVFALVAAVVVFLNQIATAGWSEYVMSWQGTSERLRQTLYVALIVGALIALMGVMISFPLALLFEQPDAGPIARILSIAIFFSAGASTFGGMLIWQNRIAASASCMLLGEVVNICVAIPALFAGHGIMAIAYGRLAGAVAAYICGRVATGLRPMAVRRFAIVVEIVKFSWNITFSRLLVAFRVYGATLIIGGFLGPAAVGYYRAGQRIVGAFEDIVSEPVRVLAWSFFRKVPQVEGSVAAVGQAGRRFFPVLIYASTPVFLGILLMAEDLTVGLLGAEWLPAVPVVQILAVAALIRATGTASVPILSVVGKVALLPRYMLLYSLISIGCITIGAMNGLLATAVSEVVAATIVFVVSAKIMRKNADLRWPLILHDSWPVLPAALGAICVVVIGVDQALIQQLHPLVRIVCLGLAMVFVYASVLLAFDRTMFHRFRNSSSQ